MNHVGKHMSEETALSRAAALCSRGEQAAADVRARLLRWGLTVDEADRVIARLTQENFLNEERYAVAFVRDKFRFNGWGRMKLAYALKQKQVHSVAIEEALATIDDEEYRATLLRLLRAKSCTLAGREPDEARAALLRFAAGRGFEPAVFYPVADEILSGRQAGHGQGEE